MTPDLFPITRRHAPDAHLFDVAVATLAKSLAAGIIRNSVYKEAKHLLGRAVSAAWERHVARTFFYSGEFERQSQAARDLYDSILIMSLHDMLGTARKLERVRISDPAIDAMREVVLEALPLARACASLKDKVVLGRAPGDPAVNAQQANPNKVVKTCPCCFRGIAVVRERMAHHGYQRPGTGYQTDSCWGVRFRPLEVSSEGLAFMHDMVKGRLRSTESAIRGLPTRDTIDELINPWSRKPTLKTFRRGEAGFDGALQRLRETWRGEAKSLRADFAKLDKMLREWAPETGRPLEPSTTSPSAPEVADDADCEREAARERER